MRETALGYGQPPGGFPRWHPSTFEVAWGMYFKQFLHDETGCASYLIASRQTRVAAVIDPQYDVQPYLDLAAERGYRIVEVIDTHLHADHLSGNRRLAAATGARLWLHALADLRFGFEPLEDGDEVRLGQLVLRVAHTPGHRPEAISLLVINPPRSPEPSMVLSGDTLFVGDVGRPDFGGPEGGVEQFRSTHRLLELPDWVEVFPAHFEGGCGKGMCGRPSSTIGFERRFNPLLQLPEDAFVRATIEPAPRPLNMRAILATNQGLGDYAWVRANSGADIPAVPAAEARGWLQAHEAAVLDVREPWEYAAAHIPCALSIPQADLALRLAELPRDGELLVVCQSGARSLRTARFLRAVGYERVTNLAGGTLAWIGAGHPVAAA
ncbi:MAG: MBL fold metallo-hydrolase [Chloroflexi bacterium]|nr:MBL fold metallo-hydrolase [Chloroflexota bacterium]